MITKARYEKRKLGHDVIDLNMGNPSDPTPQVIVDKIREAASDPRNQRYSASAGIFNLRREMARKYKRIWDVDLDPNTEVIAIFGKSWDLHTRSALGVTEEENLALISETVKHNEKNP